MKLTEITEGTTKLMVPIEEKLSKRNVVFYNPEMELSRDISIAIIRALNIKDFCDLLAGSGARGVRVKNEVGCNVILNDLNPSAIRLIKKNLELNSIEAEVCNMDANKFLMDKKFDFIDTDPFGSPSQFIDSAVKAIKNHGIIAVAATDTSALCGTYPKACMRKYDSVSLRTDYYNELGLRILIGFIARVAIRYDYGIDPLFAHSTRHYFRVYLQLNRGNKDVKNSIENLRYIQHCFNCLTREYKKLNGLESHCKCGAKFHNAGPLWAEKFANPEFCKKVENEVTNGIFNKSREAIKIIKLIEKEQTVLIPYYNFHKICEKNRIGSPPMEPVMEKLINSGFKASRTHFSGVGIRTDAYLNNIANYVK